MNEDTGSGTQVYVRDVEADRTERVARAGRQAADGPVRRPGDLRERPLRGLRVPGDEPDAGGHGRGLFRHDRRTGDMVLVSVTPTGAAATGASAQPVDHAPTAHGRLDVRRRRTWCPRRPGRIAARRDRADPLRGLHPGHRRGETVLVSVSRANTASAGQSFQPAIGGAGRFVAFASDSEILVAGDDNKTYDVFLRDLPPSPVINPAHAGPRVARGRARRACRSPRRWAMPAGRR